MSVNYSDYKNLKNKIIQSDIEWVPTLTTKNNFAPKSFMANHARKFQNPNLFTYKNVNNVVCFYIERKEACESKDGKKKFIPHSLWCRKDNSEFLEWKNKDWNENKPLYNEHLIPTTNLKILICEGEKAANFVNTNSYLKSKFLAVCWSGGSNRVYQTNFEALKNREVYLLPDNDSAGLLAMHEVAKTLIENDITENIKWFNYDSSKLAEGWDIADTLPPGESIENFLTSVEYEVDEQSWKKIDRATADRATKETLKELVNRYIYIRSVRSFWDRKYYVMVDKDELSDYYKHITKQGTGIGNLLLQCKDCVKVISYFSHAGLKPGVLSLKNNEVLDYSAGKYFNIYRPNEVEPIEEDVSEIINYYSWLLGQEKWRVVEQFIAYMVQHPGKKVLWVLLIISITEGAGKNLLMQIISACLGRHNVYENCSVAQLVSKHSTILEGTQCLCLNELSLSGNTRDKVEINNQLKNIFSDREVIIDRKNKPICKIPNLTNVIVFSNDSRCVKLNNETRRYYLSNIKHNRLEIHKRIEPLAFKIVDIADNRPGAFLNYFKKVKIENEKMFYASAPRTDDLETIIEDTKDDIHKYLDDLKGVFERKGVMSRKCLAEYLASQQTKVPFYNYNHIDDWLGNNCIKFPNGQKQKQGETANGRIRFYLLKDNFIESVGDKASDKVIFNKKLSLMSESELGKYVDCRNKEMHYF